ncbi:hypothetical protein [Enterococcus mundtii]|uniref:hypothetical protein n=1 Tax=Enterococcus mundtii TaxID=53346 RepID=UPI00403C0AD4
MFENRINTFYCVNGDGALAKEVTFKVSKTLNLNFQVQFFNLNLQDNHYFQIAYANTQGQSDFTEKVKIDKNSNSDPGLQIEMTIPVDKTENIQFILRLVSEDNLNILDEKTCYCHIVKRGNSNDEA